MKLDGRAIAAEIMSPCKKERQNWSVEKPFRTTHYYDSRWSANWSLYPAEIITRKTNWGEGNSKKNFTKISQEKLLEIIDSANRDRKIHGIIIKTDAKQIDEMAVAETVIVEKDVDGFNPKSSLPHQVALAVLKFVETAREKKLVIFENTKNCSDRKGTTAGRRRLTF